MKVDFSYFQKAKNKRKNLCKMQKQGLGCKNWEEQNKARKSWPETQALSYLHRAQIQNLGLQT